MRWLVLALVCTASLAEARTLRGTVFADANGDGKQQPGEPGVAGVVVAYDATQFVVADARGQFVIDVPDGGKGVVWVRVPDGFVPGPVWAPIAKPTALALALKPLAAPIRGPFQFVVASDTHIYDEQQYFGASELAAAAVDAVAIRPAFFALLGDISAGDTDREYDLVSAALANLDAPYVPVPGNHDWYDGGGTWNRHYGPDNYSFDIAQIHFVVWNMALKGDALGGFLAAELARVDKAMTIVALAHAPPPPEQLEAMRLLGVRYLLTGHNHANRIWDHGGLRELNTQPLMMGGIDFAPGGYRVVTVDGGALTSSHRTLTDGPYVSVIAPSCAGDQLVVAATLDAGATTVTAAIDCGAPTALVPRGGWDFAMPLHLAPGPHGLVIDARSSTGAHAIRRTTLQGCDLGPPPRAGADWPQLGGAADHAGARQRELAPPLITRWIQTIGGHALQSAPVIADGMVYVTATDLGDGTTGGVVALELATGKIAWRSATPMQVRGAPAVVDGVVAVAQVDSTLVGFDAKTGAERWRTPLGIGLPPQAAAEFSSVTADAGDILAGNQNLFGAFTGAGGTPLWTVNPVHAGVDSQSLAAIAVADDIAVGVFNRALGGLGAWDRATGAMLWRVNDGRTIAINSSPVIADGLVFVVDGSDEVWAVELATGAARWNVRLDAQGFDWGNATIATPAIAHGILVVPTLYRDVVALDASSGRELWRFAGVPSPLHATHYRGPREAGFESSPVISGDLVWVADTAGELTALELRTGKRLWHTSLDAPVLAGLAQSGGWLVAASYDGTVHALATGTAPSHAAPRCLAREGCCAAGGATSPMSTLLGAIGVAGSLRRRRRSRAARVHSPRTAGGSPPARTAR